MSQGIRTPGGTGRALRRELGVPLYLNAYALMLNTVVNSGFGLLYWIVAAHAFTDAEVGRGNALVSLMLMVSVLTQVNFGQALIRFLPRSGAGVAGAAAGGLRDLGRRRRARRRGVMAYCHLALDPGDPLHVSLPFAGWFVASTVVWSVFNLQDSALTGLRSAVWLPLENGVYGLVKLGLLVVVARTSLAEGVFTLLDAAGGGPAGAGQPADLPADPAAPRPRRGAGDRRRRSARCCCATWPATTPARCSPSCPRRSCRCWWSRCSGAEQGAYFLPAQTVFVAMNMLSLGITSSLVVEAAKDEAQAAPLRAVGAAPDRGDRAARRGRWSRWWRRGCSRCSARSTGRTRRCCCSC